MRSTWRGEEEVFPPQATKKLRPNNRHTWNVRSLFFAEYKDMNESRNFEVTTRYLPGYGFTMGQRPVCTERMTPSCLP